MAKHTATEKTARFWVWHKGWVKLSVMPGETLSWNGGGPCEEGYHYHGFEYHNGGGEVFYSWSANWRDCDGPGEGGAEMVCPIDRLRVEVPYTAYNPRTGEQIPEPGILLPAWEKVESYRRDYFAEAAGY